MAKPIITKINIGLKMSKPKKSGEEVDEAFEVVFVHVI
jgi:hypothetical protein